MTSTTFPPSLDGFFKSLQNLPTFDSRDFANRLQQASRSTLAMSAFNKHFTVPVSNQQGTTFDGQNCEGRINTLAAVTAARGMALLNDDFGFHKIVDTAKVLDLCKRNVAGLIPNLYGEHVNSHLLDAKMPNLQQLRTDTGFVQAYQNELLHPTFDHLALMHDDAANNRDYTTNLIFVNEYLKHGPGYDMTEEIPSQTADPTHWVTVVANWIKIAISPAFVAQYPNVKATALVPSTTVVYALGGYSDASAQALASTVKQSAPDLAGWNIDADIRNYTSLGQSLWASWDNTTAIYQNAVQGSEADHTQSIAVLPAGHTTSRLKKTTYAEAVAQFVSNFSSLGIFTGTPGNRVQFSPVNPPAASCFAPGTKVLLKDKTSVAIESLKEGTEILTEGGSAPQFGICSDEEVVHPTDDGSGEKIDLWGFNGIKPFFTANHVFHTTTGLRAIDPTAAKQENPWAEIGSLQVGHSVIHTEDGSSYKPVPISSLASTLANCENVYGVHLRSGRRSYHADGYLVHLNYPEITIKSLSKLLSPMNNQQRLTTLSSLKELQPLFERFGAMTMLAALDKQLNTADKLPTNLLSKAATKQKTMKQSAQHLNRSWTLVDDKPSATNDPLPTVQVREGVVHVENQYIKQAKVSNTKILWTRPVNNNLLEHGYVNLNPDLLGGTGALVTAPENVTPDITKPENVRSFIATPQSSIAVAPPQVAKSASVDAAFPTLFNLPTPHMPTPPSGFQWGPNGTLQPIKPTPGAPPFQPAQLVKSTPGTSKPASTSITPTPNPTYPVIDYYQLSYDTAGWMQGQTVPKSPAQYFQIYDTMLGTLKNYSCRIPALDQIRDKLCTKTQVDNNIQLACIPELYDCWSSLDDESNTVLNFEIKQPELIAQAADGYDANSKTHSYSYLKFTNLGLSVTVPFIFQSMRFTFSFDAQSVIGIARAYDPTMTGTMGKRILLTGNYIDPPTVPSATVRQAIAVNTVGNKSGDSLKDLTSAHQDPPAFVSKLAAVGSQAVPTDNSTGAQELASNLPLNSDDVQEASQRILYRTMLFHMSDSDLNNFTGEVRPSQGTGADQIPSSLGSNLETQIASWIQNSYTPMWIAKRVISMSDTVQKTWRVQFTDAEKKRINYFWTGKGKTCMSQAPEYNMLNQLTASAALRQVSPRLAQYADDPTVDQTAGSKTQGMSGGKRWAEVLFNSQAFGPNLNQLCLSYNTSDQGYNKAQKLCNIFQVLSPIPTQVPVGGWTSDNKPYAMRLMDAINVRSETIGIALGNVPISFSNDADIEREYQWLADSMQALWLDLLNGKSGYGDQVSGQLLDDFNNLCTQLGIDATASAQFKSEQAVLLTARILRANVTFARGYADAKKGWAKAKAAGDAAIAENDDPKVPSKAAGYLSLAMAIGTVALFVSTSWMSFRDFGDLSPVDRAKLVLAAAQTALVMLAQAKDAWKAFHPDPAKPTGISPVEQSVAAASVEDNNPGQVEQQRQEIFPDPDSKEAGSMAYPIQDQENASPSATTIEKASAASLKASGEQLSLEPPPVQDPIEEKIPELAPAPPKPTPPAATKSIGTKLQENFSISAHGIRVAMFVVGVAMTILSCIGLAASWNKLTIVSRVLDVASIVQQGLSGIVELTTLTLDIATTATEALTGIAAGVATVCAWAGPILAIVGIALMVAILIWQSKQPPPLTPVEQWIQDTGKKIVSTLLDPPVPKLTWSATSPLSAGKDNTVFTLTGKNASTSGAILYSVKFSVLSGTADSALLANTSIQAQQPKLDGSLMPLKYGFAQCQVSPDARGPRYRSFGVAAGQPQEGTDKKTQTEYTIGVVAFASDPDIMTINANGTMSFQILGKIGVAGTYQLTVTETWVDADNLPWDDISTTIAITKQ